jgi:hypothetical protein
MKKHLLSVIALSLAIASVAFTNPKPAKHFNPRWFYKLTTTAGESDPANYEALNGQDGLCGSSGTVRCVIEAPDNGHGQPNLAQMTVISKKPN